MRKINTFWNWFQDNNQTIKNLINETPKNQKHISFWINKNLSYYCKEIDFMIVFPKNGNTRSEFIITANGNPEYFNQVIDLVDNSPKLKNWKFTAFIHPMENIEKVMAGLDKPYVFQDITLKASELKFMAINYEENIQKLDIIIFFKYFNIHCNNKTLNQAIYIILQDLIGEKSLYQNINLIHLAQMPDNTEELIYLHDLQSFIDTFI
ncbi:hypothetical protein EKL98_11375 [Flavobacterium bomense]|uniref:DUF695 domain-containing protein n=1 Tax=Flavobacterium bomense TaxID=2497483 RepID=A0A3S0MHK8_9FLAO|nr:hypothetical protein [Flavobacterium bomense]RTZ03587.1 hypothetical protein EKL98_11375 [Flavobacterium bomense]